MTRDPYRILGINVEADADAVRRAYRDLARLYHPDVNGNPQAKQIMQELNWAYAILSNPIRRRHYDLLKKLKTR